MEGKHPVNVRQRLSPTEQALAYLIGAGIVLTIIALMLMAFGTIDNTDITNSLLVVGIALIVIGIIAWLVLVKPWEEFDDLQTPLDAGGHAHHTSVPAVDKAAAPVAPDAELPSRAAAGVAIPAGAEVEVEAEAPDAEAAVAEEIAPASDDVSAEVEVEAEAPDVEAAVTEEIAPASDDVPTEVEAELKPPLAETAPVAVDDLTAVSGVGPKTAEALAKGGITSYAQMADLAEAELLDIGRANGARVSNTEGWSAAAAALAAQGPRDNLTVIEGIGPKSQAALYDAGVFTYKQVSESTVEALQAVLDANELRLLDPQTWPEQAGYLARGDMAGLEKLQDELKGGRRV